jgi:4-hydroxy-2-oxoheptanedioate aldolase
MTKTNDLKRSLKQGKTVLGTWNILPSSSVVNVLAASGLDFVVIDMEHGPISYETAEDMVRAAEVEGCTPLIRVPRNDEAEILRALDIGAHGVVVPHIETAADREKAIKAIKYHPIGERGLSPFTRAGGYDPEDTAKHTERANAETMSVLIVEGQEGAKNLEAIIDDANVDVVYFGLCDLSQALGIPGQLDSPKLKEFVKDCVTKAKKKQIAVGAFTADMKMLKWFKEIGLQFITYSLDSTELCRAFKRTIKEFK